MKKSLLFILFFIYTSISAQLSYSFNYKLKLKSEEKFESVKNFYQLVNSKILHYNLYTANDINGDLIDTQRNTVAHIYIDKEDSKLKYDFLDHLKVPELYKYNINNDHISIDEIEPNKFSIKCYEEDAKNPNLEFIVNLEPFEDDLIRFYNVTFNDDLHIKITNSLKEKLNENFNYYIREYTMKDKEGLKKYSIEKPIKVNLNLINTLKEEEVIP
jgi:hypothetical protein